MNPYDLLREPFQSELDYFDKNRNVTGMAAEDNKIILNRNNTIKYNNENLSIEIEKIHKISSEPIYIKDLNIMNYIKKLIQIVNVI